MIIAEIASATLDWGDLLFDVTPQSDGTRKLFQKPYIIFAEESNIIDAVF